MVLVTIHVRPRDGYTYAGRIKTITVDSSCRLEQVIADLKLDTKKGIALFSREGRDELALNTSLASNNVQSEHLLETCSSPLLASVLSAALTDLDKVQKLPEEDRTRERIEPLLDLDGLRWTLEPWPERWNHDSVKSRIVCMALMKKIIQRQDRYANLIVPQCTNLMELYQFLQVHVFSDEQQPNQNRRTHNSMAHIFKPFTSRDGEPSTVWQLLQIKLDKMNRISVEPRAGISGNADYTTSCRIEAFLKSEKERHDILKGASTPSGASCRRRPPSSDSQHAQRKRRRLDLESPSGRLKDREWQCSHCKTAEADCVCLTDMCPFGKQASCSVCFSANHPILQRDHESIPFTDARAKALLKSLHREAKQDLYCPQYASGPFAILCTLFRQMQLGHLSLDESRLREMAQQICRSNLYDHQAQGRNAFACIEGLMNKDLVRMERLPGRRANQEGIYSLLPAGEALAKYCFTFEGVVSSVLTDNPTKRANANSRHDNPITLIIDTREDQTYAKRLIRRCEVGHVPYQLKELPAGDYLFVVDGKVCPIVVERKSWSDLADSVLGKGQQQRRLDCVKIGENQPQCENGRCQLCKMKASGCSKIMFLIEGARCDNRDDAPDKCTADKRCQYCNEIQQRHRREIVHESLEEVLFKLQAYHGCFVHYTRSYNETIDVLLSIRDVLGADLASVPPSVEEDDMSRAIALSLGIRPAEPIGHRSDPFNSSLSLSYEQFCTNVRRKGENRSEQRVKPSIVEWDDNFFVKSIFDGSVEASFDELAKGQQGRASHVVDLNDSFSAACKSAEDDPCDALLALNGVDPPRGTNSTSRTSANNELVILDSDDESQGSVQVVDHALGEAEVEQAATPASRVVGANDSSMNAPHARTSLPPFLLLNGLYKYDFEFYKDLSDLWKALYQNHKAAGAAVDGFESSCKTELRKLQDDANPLVHRTTILFWLLQLQVRYGGRVQIMRQSRDKVRLLALFEQDATVDPSTTLATPVRGARRSTRRDVATTCPKYEPECIICTFALGKTDVDVLQCMHCFHTKCLQLWLNSKSSQNRCPLCKHDIGTHAGRCDKQITKALESATMQRNRPPLDTEKERARLARLARFDTSSASRPTSATAVRSLLPSNDTGDWRCSLCTLVNTSKADQCEACDSVKPRGPWRCGTCTLLNATEASVCAACCASKARDANDKSDAAFVSEFERPVVYTRPHSPEELMVGRGLVTATPVESIASTTIRSKVKCGACRLPGHNRATATESNCPKFFDRVEVERRAKIAAEKLREAQETDKNIARVRRESANLSTTLEEAKRALASLEQAAAADARLRTNEIKRLEKQKARAEKRAQKYR